jgi:Fe-S cluster assembly protein SufD
MASPIAETDTNKARLISSFRPESFNGTHAGVPARDLALSALDQLQIPTTKWEAWKYTSLKSILDKNYQISGLETPESVKPYLIPGFDADILVFVNGKFAPSLSSVSLNREKVVVQSFHDLDASEKEIFKAHFAGLVEPDEDFFTALNTAFATDGVWIRVPKGRSAAYPVHIIHLSGASGDPSGSQFRNLFLIEENASVKIVESYHSLDSNESLRNAVTEVFVEKNASLEYVKLQRESDSASHIESVRIRQEDDSRCSIFTLTFSGKLVRNNLNVLLDGKNCESHLMGLYLLDGDQHVDNHTQVDHMQPNSFSNELYKGILADHSAGVFNGRIHVHRPAQKTNAFQSNRNILLSDNANAYSKPQLEIYADDVKCSHGATAGQLDKEAMFYLQSRGINKEAATILLMHAFASEVVEDLGMEDLRQYVYELIRERFAN